jgi:hypothetical protein
MDNDDKYVNLAVSRYYASVANKKRFRNMRFKKIFNKPLEKITDKLLEFYNLDTEQFEIINDILIDRLDLDELFDELEKTLV